MGRHSVIPLLSVSQVSTSPTAARRIHQDVVTVPVRSTKRKKSRQLVLHANQANIRCFRSRHSVTLRLSVNRASTSSTAARRTHQDVVIAPVRSTKRKKSRQLVLHASQAN